MFKINKSKSKFLKFSFVNSTMFLVLEYSLSDLNGDFIVDVLDVVIIVNIILENR